MAANVDSPLTPRDRVPQVSLHRLMAKLSTLQAQLAHELEQEVASLLAEREELCQSKAGRVEAAAARDEHAGSSVRKPSSAPPMPFTTPRAGHGKMAAEGARRMWAPSTKHLLPALEQTLDELTAGRRVVHEMSEISTHPALKGGPWEMSQVPDSPMDPVFPGEDPPDREPSTPGLARSNSSWKTPLTSPRSSKSTSKRKQSLEPTRSGLQDWLNQQLTVPPSFEEKERNKSGLARFVNSWAFSTMSGAIIVTNAVYIGIYADFTLRNELQRIDGKSSAPRWWVSLQVFNLLFLLEIMIRLCAEGKKFYWGKNALWNIFDSIVVGMTMSNIVLTQGAEAVPQISYLRICRLVRVIQTFEVFRLPIFSHLRMISNAMVRALPVCFWAATIGAMCIYMSSVAFVLGIAGKMQSIQAEAVIDDAVVAADVAKLRTYFPDLSTAMIHLYMGITGGIDWESIYLSLEPLNFWYKLGFLMFTIFLLFVVLNITTGMVIERAFKVVKQDRDFWLMEASTQRSAYENRVRGLFHQMDLDSSGTVTLDEFSDALNSPLVEAYLSFIEIDTVDLYTVFELLDKDDSGSIEIDEFIDGVHELRGVVHKAQVKQLHLMVQRMQDHLCKEEELPMPVAAPALPRSTTVQYRGGQRISVHAPDIGAD